MSTPRDAALKSVEGALENAVSKLCGMYETCLIDAGGDTAKEAECKQIWGRSLQFANRAYTDMLEAVNQQWPHAS